MQPAVLGSQPSTSTCSIHWQIDRDAHTTDTGPQRPHARADRRDIDHGGTVEVAPTTDMTQLPPRGPGGAGSHAAWRSLAPGRDAAQARTPLRDDRTQPERRVQSAPEASPHAAAADAIRLSFAVCTYNRAERLPALLAAMRAQECPLPFEVLVVDNRSSDDTPAVIARCARASGPPVRCVREERQGIPHARSRALAEAMQRDVLVFIDDDELPQPGLLASAVRALGAGGARCVGGKVKVRFAPGARPSWLGDELLGFLAEVDYGERPFPITDLSTPVWTANVAYDMRLFRDDPGLRFDARYNRRGVGVGGGSDAVMFRELLERGEPIAYCPQMVVDHHVEDWRLRRRYFLRLRFVAGRKQAQYETGEYPRALLGVPPFMLVQAARHAWRTAVMLVRGDAGLLRQAMNLTHAAGMIWGRMLRWRELRRAPQGLR